MSPEALKKSVLTRQDWLEGGVEILRSHGVDAVSIVRLAEELGISRGSFYHHFVDRADLLEAMLEYWETNWTVRIRDDVRGMDSDPVQSLLELIRAIRRHGAADYDSAFRVWALHDETAAAVVRRVDEFRIGFIRMLFQAAGFRGIDAENRARMLLYYEVSEPVMFDEQSEEEVEELILLRHQMLTDGAS